MGRSRRGSSCSHRAVVPRSPLVATIHHSPGSRHIRSLSKKVGRGALTTVVLLVLAMIWAAVLIVPLVKARADGTFSDSVGTFRRQITVLERAAPGTVKPANRLRGPVAGSTIPPYRPPASVRQQARL